jgi:hypothetical protein
LYKSATFLVDKKNIKIYSVMAEMATDETGITPIFADFQKYLTADQELREVVITFILQRSTTKKNLPTPLIDIVESRNIA